MVDPDLLKSIISVADNSWSAGGNKSLAYVRSCPTARVSSGSSRSWTSSAGTPPAWAHRECKRLINADRTIHWIKGHRERSHTPRSGWSQDQWGNYIADLYAGRPHPPRQSTTFPGPSISPTLPYHLIARAAIRATDWQFISNTHIPMLASPSHAISRAALADYLYNRDASRASRGAPPRWGTTTVSLAAQA